MNFKGEVRDVQDMVKNFAMMAYMVKAIIQIFMDKVQLYIRVQSRHLFLPII